MRALPGDPEYSGEIVEDLLELRDRLDTQAEELLGLYRNVGGVAEIVTSLGLSDDEAVAVTIEEVVESANEIFETAAGMIQTVMRLAGLELDDSVPEADATDAKVSLLPPELQDQPEELRKELLGKRVYGLSKKELTEHPHLREQAEFIVVVSDQGKTLTIRNAGRVLKESTHLHDLVVRGINIYIWLQVAGVKDFKLSDVNDTFGPQEGLKNLVDPVSRTNATLSDDLGLSKLFTDNGQAKGSRRYIPTGKVVFVNAGSFDPDSAGNAS